MSKPSATPVESDGKEPSVPRGTKEVFEDHLRRALEGDLEGDLASNYAEDVILLTGVGELRGHDGIRQSPALPKDDVPDAKFEYVTQLVADEYAFLEWNAEGEEVQVSDGADGFVIRDGLIRAHTIHYTVIHRMGTHQPVKHE